MRNFSQDVVDDDDSNDVDDLKTKKNAALDELLFRRVITKENYKDIKEVVWKMAAKVANDQSCGGMNN